MPQTHLRGLLCFFVACSGGSGILGQSADVLAEQFYSTGKSQSLFSSLQHDTKGTGAKNQVQNDTAVTPALKNSHTLDFTGKRELIDESRAAELLKAWGQAIWGRSQT